MLRHNLQHTASSTEIAWIFSNTNNNNSSLKRIFMNTDFMKRIFRNTVSHFGAAMFLGISTQAACASLVLTILEVILFAVLICCDIFVGTSSAINLI